jgi:hypothetical protein
MSMPSEERKIDNETMFREANEEIRRTQVDLDLPDRAVPFLCECDDEECRTIVHLTPEQYERVRANPHHFLVAEGHSTDGRVVAEHKGFVVSQKEGRAAEIAEATDPRHVVDEDQRRLGENEVLYRAVNERIEDLSTAFGMVTETMSVVCECGDIKCAEQIEVDLPTYERIRAEPTLFFIRPGHEYPDVEDIVEHTDRYDVVRKRPGEAAAIAAETDPRA